MTAFQTCGLEEWITGSEQYLTTVRCSSATSLIRDPAVVQLYMEYFGEDDPGLYCKAIKKLYEKEKGVQAERIEYQLLKAQRGRVFKIKREQFEKLVATKHNSALQEYAHEKMVFLRNRVKYLAEQATQNIHTVLYHNSVPDVGEHNPRGADDTFDH